MRTKSYDEQAQMAQEFKKLKPEEQAKKLGDLSDGIKRKEEAKVAVEKQIRELTKSLESAKGNQDAISKKIVQLSSRVPVMLAFEQDIGTANDLISQLASESDVLGQTCAGLKARIRDLGNETSFLEAEISEDKWLSKFYRLIPLPDQWNKIAVKLIPIIEEIYDLSSEIGFAFASFSGGTKAVYPSNWDSFEIIPRLLVIGDTEDRWPNGRIKDIWNYSQFKQERRAKKQTEEK
jgi:hypothetical protein